jgi:hypothetical protein
MYPHERSLVKRLEGKPFALIGVNSDDDREALKATLASEGITWRSFWNGGGTDGPITRAWRVQVWPTLYVIDHKGVIRYKDVDGAALDQAVDTLLREMEASK